MKFPIEAPSQEEVPDSLYKEISRIVDGAQSAAHPVFVHTLGIPGSGKSSFARALNSKLSTPENTPVLVNFDSLMEAMPEYKAEKDIVKAFGMFEMPARAAGYLLLKKLLGKKANIILDHSGSRQDHVEMLKYAKQLGYKIIVARIVASREAVEERILKRQEIEERFTPLNYIDERDKIINGLSVQYKKVADFYTEVPNDAVAHHLDERCSEVLKTYNKLISA